MATQSELLRSYVDPATNEMLIADFDLLDYIDWTRGRPVKGSKLLANFLHEWTHRWCFHSRVGSAMALLRLRAGTRSLQGISAFDDHVRGMTAGMLLEPIAEGLSLFAEFDTYPGKSPWLSQTLVTASLFFSPAVETDDRPELLIQGLLQSLRRDPRLVERKAGIYAKKGLDPYLVGYLSVKSLWAQMAAACEDFEDRDLFLSYVRSYFYDDPGMVSVLLRPAQSEIQAAQNIANYLLSRVTELVSFQNLSDNVRRWLSSAEAGHVDITTIGSNQAAEQESQMHFDQALIEDLRDGGDENVAAWVYMLLEERSIGALGSAPVKLRSTDNRQVEVVSARADTVIYTLKEPGLVGHDAGELFAISTSNGRGLFFIIGVGQSVFLASKFGQCNESDLQIAKRFVANRPDSEKILQEMRKLIDDSVSENIWSMIKQRLEPALKTIFGPLCTLNADEEVWEESFEKLLEQGLYGILDEDGELTRAFAGIGLLNSFTSNVEMIRSFAPLLDVDEESMSRALQLGRQCGLRLIAGSSSSVIALV